MVGHGGTYERNRQTILDRGITAGHRAISGKLYPGRNHRYTRLTFAYRFDDSGFTDARNYANTDPDVNTDYIANHYTVSGVIGHTFIRRSAGRAPYAYPQEKWFEPAHSNTDGDILADNNALPVHNAGASVGGSRKIAYGRAIPDHCCVDWKRGTSDSGRRIWHIHRSWTL